MLLVILVARDAAVFEHFRNLVPEACHAVLERSPLFSGRSEGMTFLARRDGDPGVLVAAGFDENPERLVILIADDLIASGQPPQPSPVVGEILQRYADRAIATIAIRRPPERTPDIDRVVPIDCGRAQLERALDAALSRLVYLRLPPKTDPVHSSAIVIRPIRDGNETEFRDYFALRHKIYSIMGYLEAEVENCPSGLEINEADAHSLHFGAFHFCPPGQRLVGTARLVTNTGADPSLLEMFTRMARGDLALIQRIRTPYPAGLPIFQTHDAMTPVMVEVFKSAQLCCELSRVIVHPEFRGLGLAHGLVEFALNSVRQRALREGAQLKHIFLECLKVHESLYQQHGFETVPGLEGRVIDVCRTMIAMRRDFTT
jgi:predicted GNAT family N-acyltransferase